MRAGVEHPVVAVVVEQVVLALFELEVHVGRNDMRRDLHHVDVLHQLLLRLLELLQVVEVATAQPDLQLRLLYLLVDFVHLLEVLQLVAVVPHQTALVDRPEVAEELLQLVVSDALLRQAAHFHTELLGVDHVVVDFEAFDLAVLVRLPAQQEDEEDQDREGVTTRKYICVVASELGVVIS